MESQTTPHDPSGPADSVRDGGVAASEENPALVRPGVQRLQARWVVIALLALNLVAIAGVLSGVNFLYDRNIREAEIRSQNVSLAIDLALTNEIAKIDVALVATIDDLGHHHLGEGEDRASNIYGLVTPHQAQFKETEGWGIADASGTMVFHEENGNTTYSAANREYFKDLKSGKRTGFVVTEPLVSRVTGNLVIVLARAYTDQSGAFAGVVAVPLPVSYLDAMLSRFDVGPRGVISLRDSQLGLIARAPSSYRGIPVTVGDARMSPEATELLAAGKTSGTYHARTVIDDIERIYSFRAISNASFYTFVGVSKHDYLADWRRLTSALLGFLGVFLLVTDASAAFAFRHWRRERSYAVSLQETNARLQGSVREIEERDKALIAAQDAGGLGTYTLDLASGVWRNSDKIREIFGIDTAYPPTVEGWRKLVHPDDLAPMQAYFRDEVIGKHGIFDYEYRVVRPSDGKVVWLHGLGKLEFDAEGKPVRLVGTSQDISERKFAEERLQLARAVFQNSSNGILITDAKGVAIEANPAFTTITGYAQEDLAQVDLYRLVSPSEDDATCAEVRQSLREKGYWEGEVASRRKSGEPYTQQSRVSALRDPSGHMSSLAAVIADVTELKESQRQLERMAYYDRLTGLANRGLLADRMAHAMSQCRRKGNELLGVCALDLDGFKEVNDRLGHEAGDQLLIEVAQRLQGCTRDSDTVARLGGDEFVVLFCGLTQPTEVESAVSRMIRAAAEPYHIGGVSSYVTISVGVTLYPHDAVDDPDALLRHADQAMYDAKRAGKNRMHFFDTESDRRLRHHQQQYARLVEAIANDELRLVYQPKVELRTGKVVGVEALLRWQHPELGLLAPSHFLPSIEATELVLPVGEWVLEEALAQRQRWLAEGIDLEVSVNVFGLHLQRADFADRLASILNAYPQLDPTGLELEILETTALEDLGEITERIQECTPLGVRFSLDDFGTGYSSLTYLRQLPAFCVKIDRTFVHDMLDNNEDKALVQGIVGMAHTLKRTVVAEGVETLEHAIPLLHCGCDRAQGYGIARPMEPALIPAWLARWRMPRQWEEALAIDVISFGRRDPQSAVAAYEKDQVEVSE